MHQTIRRSARCTLPLLALCALLLVLAVPAAAETSEPSECSPRLAFLGAESPEILVASLVADSKEASIDGPSALAECTADCGDGTTVTCSGSTCTATDRNCPNEQGHCTSNLETKYCSEACETCYFDPYCPELNGTSCSGSVSTECQLDDGSCSSCTCKFGTWFCKL